MKVLAIVLGLTLAAGLVVGLTLPGLAAPEAATPSTDSLTANDEPPGRDGLMPGILRGKVTSVDEGKTFFVIQSQGEELTISVNDDTQYFTAPVPRKLGNLAQQQLELRQEQKLQVQSQEKVKSNGQVSIKLMPKNSTGLMNRAKINQAQPQLQAENQELNLELLTLDNAGDIPQRWSGRLEWLRRFGEESTFDAITPGAQVIVGLAAEEENHLAKWVLMVTPVTPVTTQPTTGTVTALSQAEKTITIAPADGSEAVTLNYNDKTRFVLQGTPQLEVGQTVRAVGDEETLARVVMAPAEAVAPTDTE
jgi:hypothetical protein